MSWMRKLSITYDNCKHKIGDTNEVFPLLPIGHTTKEATHVCITLDMQGNFRRAKVLDKNEAQSIIPVTEESAGRTSGEGAHPLADQLQYIAGDYKKYGGDKKSYFDEYKHKLSEWTKSSFSVSEVVVVYNYILKGNVISDLVKAKILYLDEDGKLLKKWTRNKEEKPPIFNVLQNNQQQSDCFVRWNVEVPEKPDFELQWNKSVWQSWINYYLSTKKTTGLCYATGQEMLLAQQHPKKILPGEANAKLISSNDTRGFTFRGRFLNDSQACNVGYEISQKAHNALMWLIRRQGSSNDTQSIVAWATKQCDIINPSMDTLSLILREKGKEDSSFNAAQNLGIEFKKMVEGYKGMLGNTENVIVMVLDSMTSGRAAIKYYCELSGSEYLERIEKWHTNCSWRQRYSEDKNFVGAPSPADISKAAYGTHNEKDNRIVINEKLLSSTIERLLPCIVNSAFLPRDILELCINQMKHRHSFESWEWEKNLGITCALYRYTYFERNYSMALEENRNSRDYLYGRLLAIAESIEKIALSTTDEKRPTNAERLMQRFADKPFSTWRTIELALNPSKQRLKANRPGFLANREKELMAVKAKFSHEDFCDDGKLSGEFLLGYDCQRVELPPWRNNNEDNGTKQLNN